MTLRGREGRHRPRNLTTPLAATLVAFGLAGCPGRNPDTDAGDVQRTDAADRQDVGTGCESTSRAEVQGGGGVERGHDVEVFRRKLRLQQLHIGDDVVDDEDAR